MPLQRHDPRLVYLEEVDCLRILVNCTLLVLLNPNADMITRHVVAFCQTTQRFAGEKFLRDLTFEFDAVTLPRVFLPKTR
ncbi:hypothetical protein ATC00_04955 [Sinorhizobium americanum]|nr:hypothetical protein ATC00_04955 [Sinorhizobium americanum]